MMRTPLLSSRCTYEGLVGRAAFHPAKVAMVAASSYR